ncbi:histidine permease [Conoideocrella luteorostrata]|uniref:Histidine permease n=1 Tax=Conoideocrella luteorostrata TaxID=1105319 RepID=A0AAJ0CP42_9HYPO|nr:histidine permease [Conoideocrella luteorostrata]
MDSRSFEDSLELGGVGDRRFSSRGSPQTRTMRLLEDFKRNKSETFFPDNPLTQVNSSGYRSIDEENRQFIGNDIMHSGLARKLKGRHLQMIAISGSIGGIDANALDGIVVGTGLFIMTGQSLATGGPASMLLAYAVVGVSMYCTCHALGELAVVFPIAGSFSSWATRFIDPSWGFALGWNYALQWLVSFPVEVVAASEVVGFWNQSLPRAIFVTLFIALIITINMFGIKTYGEAEYVFAVIKITAVVGFILFGIILNCAGTPDRGYIGFEYWQDPGAFHNGFKGFCSVVLSAAFAFSGTELVGLAAAETANPRKSMPLAIKQVFWRITLFYISTVLLIGILIRYDNPRLTYSGTSDTDANASPLVIAFEEAGLQVFPSVINAVILIAVLSVANSAVFGSSRTLAALAVLRLAPRGLAYIDRKGRPLVAILIAALVGLLGYLAELPERDKVLDWLTSIGGLSGIFTWGTICACHIQFRRAWGLRGRAARDLPYRSPLGIGGSLLGLVLNICFIVSQVWVAIFPIHYAQMPRADLIKSAALKLMGVLVVLICYAVHKLVYRTRYIAARKVDVDSGRREYNVHLLEVQEGEERAVWPRWKKLYKFLC